MNCLILQLQYICLPQSIRMPDPLWNSLERAIQGRLSEAVWYCFPPKQKSRPWMSLFYVRDEGAVLYVTVAPFKMNGLMRTMCLLTKAKLNISQCYQHNRATPHKEVQKIDWLLMSQHWRITISVSVCVCVTAGLVTLLNLFFYLTHVDELTAQTWTLIVLFFPEMRSGSRIRQCSDPTEPQLDVHKYVPLFLPLCRCQL